MPGDEARLLQELQTHQVELETQNEELRRLQAELAASKARYFDLYDLAPVGYFSLDAKGVILEANLTAAGLLGSGRRDLAKQQFSRFVHPDDQDLYYRYRRRPAEPGAPRSCELRMLRAGAGAFWARLDASDGADSDGALLARVTLSDISGKKHEEASLLRLKTAIEQVGDAIIITDAAGDIQFVNPAFEAATGYAAREVLGKNPRLLKSGRHDAAFYRALWDTLASGRNWAGLMLNRRKDGSLTTAETIISPVRDASGRVVNYMAVERDITERLELESRLRQAQKMEVVGRLAGGVAHDFNNLLTAILGNCGFLLDAIPEGDPKRPDVVEIRDAGLRAAALTRQLLAFSRKQVMVSKPIDLNALLEAAVTLLRRLVGEDIQLTLRLDPGLPPVLGDPGQLEQVVMNLAVNARDAMPNGGVLALETSAVTLAAPRAMSQGAAIPPGRYALVTVSDTGSGMDEETMRHLFEPFFTTKDPGKGTGLGLSTAFGIARQSGGFFDVESEPGRGTAFKLFLPASVAASVESRPVSPRERPGPAAGCGIMVVEDQSIVRRLVVRILKSAGHSVLEAGSGEQALALAGRPFDLLLTDIALGDMSGVVLAERLKAGRPGLRVIYMSGYSDSPEVRAVLSQPENHFLQKPFTPAALTDLVSETSK